MKGTTSIVVFCKGCNASFSGKPIPTLRSWVKHELSSELCEYTWYEVRRIVLERDGFKCVECGTKKNLHIHHIKSRKEGGVNCLSNLVSLCRDCHQKKHPFPLLSKQKIIPKLLDVEKLSEEEIEKLWSDDEDDF